MKKNNVQRTYDIDFARMEKISREPYYFFFDLFIDVVIPYLKQIDPRARQDADEYETNRIRELMLRITTETQNKFNLPKLEGLVKETNTNIQRKSQKSFLKQVEKIITVVADPKNLEIASEQNRQLVAGLASGFSNQLNATNKRASKTTASDLYLAQEQSMGTTILNRVMAGVSAGERWEEIAKAVIGSASTKTGKQAVEGSDDSQASKIASRAAFIARNATSTIIGEYDKTQQQGAGVQFYMWQTAEDERVRPTHVALGDRVFAYDPGTRAPDAIDYGASSFKKGQTVPQAKDSTYNSGAPTFPGQPWNCRCVAVALIPGIDY